MSQYHTQDPAKILEGILLVRDIVRTTFGAHPRNVTISDNQGGISMNDGVNIIKMIRPSDPEQALGVSRSRRAAEATWRATGDGTTSTALLMGAICTIMYARIQERFSWLLSLWIAFCSFLGIKSAQDGGMERRFILTQNLKAQADEVVSKLKGMARHCDDGSEQSLTVLQAVAKIAMHGHEWSADIAHLLWQLGREGAFSVEVSKTGQFETEKIEGFRWDAGLYTLEQANKGSRFVTNDCLVSIVAGEVSDLADIKGITGAYAAAYTQGERRPLLIVAQSMNGNALSSLVKARMGNGEPLPIILVRCPGKYGYEILEDMAAVTGTKIFNKTQGLFASGSVSLNDFGRVSKATISDRSATFVAADNTTIIGRTAVLNEQAQAVQGEQEEAIRQRISNLHGLYGVIRIGVNTETDFGYMQNMVDDCYRAVQSALVHGVLPGGGQALWHTTRGMGPLWEQIGDTIVNAVGGQGCHDPWHAIDMITRRVDDAVEIGVLDNAGSVCEALLNAVTESAALINTQYFIINPPPTHGVQ